MRHIIDIMIIILLVTTSVNSARERTIEGVREDTLVLTFSHPTIMKTSIGVTLLLEEANKYYLEGFKPVLPVHIEVFKFPMGTKILEVELKPRRVSLEKLLQPLKTPPLPKFSIPLPKSIESTRVFPSEWYSSRIGVGIDNSEHILYLSIAIFPVRYNISFRGLEILRKCELMIRYVEEERKIPDIYDLLIISPGEYREEIEKLKQHKELEDYRVKIVNISDIPSIGRDLQESIKYFIKQAIEKWGIKYVLLVGNERFIPSRMVYVEDIRDIFTNRKCFISDLYYADIYDANGNFSSWDSNGNNRFSEYKSWLRKPLDDVDLYPDIYIGRIPCNNREELRIYIDKIISYENSNTPPPEWFKRIILVGGDTFTEDISGVEEGEVITAKIAEIMKGFSAEKIWDSNGKLRHAEDINKAIEKGAGFIAFEGHAGANSYRTHPHRTRNEWIPVEWYRTYHIRVLSNDGKLPIVTADACNICSFSSNYTCFGWAFLSKEDGGGIATIGMSSFSWIYPGRFCTEGLGGLIHIKTYEAYQSSENKTLGEIWSKAVIGYLNSNPWGLSAYDYKTIEAWELLGDPSLQIPIVKN